ncbi:uncharacterized protein LOC121864840 [Homarus americanus]|nr:uncharacterized protein LOC121864840 [Homarus americanus]
MVAVDSEASLQSLDPLVDDFAHTTTHSTHTTAHITRHTTAHITTYTTGPDTLMNPAMVLFSLAINFVCLVLMYRLCNVHKGVRKEEQRNTAVNSARGQAGPREIPARPGEWVRPLNNMEWLFWVAALLDTGNTAQVLWLSSSRPIPPEDVKEALSVVAQKLHALQLCVVWRWCRPWFRLRKNVTVDFDVVDTDDVMTVCYQQMRASYNLPRGPLWRARIVPQPQPAPDRYEAVLVLTLHHVITDGLTNMVLSRDVLEVLNAIMSGRSHNTPVRRVIPNIYKELAGPYHYLNCFRLILFAAYRVLVNIVSEKNFNVIFTHPRTKLAVTKIHREDFPAETTRQLLRQCKENKASVHSCVMAAASLALFRIAQKQSQENLDSLKLVTDTPVNLRRYYGSEYAESLGSVSSLVKQVHLLSDAHTKENFWALARRMYADLHHALDVDKTPISSSLIAWTMAALQPINYLLTHMGYRNLIHDHLMITNMGNLRHLLPGKYDGPVEITSLLRSTASELVGCPLLLVLQTFEGRLLLSLDYYTNNSTEEVAWTFFSYLTQYIKDIAHNGTITGTPVATPVSPLTPPASPVITLVATPVTPDQDKIDDAKNKEVNI